MNAWLLALAAMVVCVVAGTDAVIRTRPFLRGLEYHRQDSRHARPATLAACREEATEAVTETWLIRLGNARPWVRPSVPPLAGLRARQATLMAVAWYAALSVAASQTARTAVPWEHLRPEIWPDWSAWRV